MMNDNISTYGKTASDINADPSGLEATTSNVEGACVETDHLKREFKSAMCLVRGGIASLLIAYSIIGAVVFLIMTAVGEMATMLPSDKGFAGYATRFVDPALGYATGWNYFLKYAIVLPNNLTAAGIIIQYWRPDLNVAIFVTTFTVAIIAVNVLPISFFGEAEFWMSATKLLVIVMLILTCFIISVGGQPSGEVTGFKYWHDPGALGEYLVDGPTGRFLGFWAAMVQACFAYTGTEAVGVAFGEAPNPRKTIRVAVRQTLWRIVFFYVLGALMLGMSVPYTNDLLIGGTKKSTGAAASPFVIAVQLAGYNAFIPEFTVSTFMTSYIGIAIYLVNILSYKVYAKTKKVELTTMDLVTNRLEDDGIKYPSTLEKAVMAVTWVMRRCKN
ncbi:hypothetical protein FJTKL_14418 [Diaporthe vaccinii]|uniref:Amino acid permease/ SLC12A domain-containing protein n=1 Tax=Diaporthe vaccinii TaxID=105482 RepID=A0ABR4E7Y7_9PEZI